MNSSFTCYAIHEFWWSTGGTAISDECEGYNFFSKHSE